MMACCYIISEIANMLFYTKTKDTRFYYLSLKRDNNTKQWSIHGLWPQYSKTEHPTYFHNIHFDIDKLEPIITDLQTFWYDNESNSKEFWQQQWIQHGTFMFTDCNEYDYFKQALSSYVEVLQQNIIDKFPLENNGTFVKIPLDLNFKIILPY